jgi:hypothetical protein
MQGYEDYLAGRPDEWKTDEINIRDWSMYRKGRRRAAREERDECAKNEGAPDLPIEKMQAWQLFGFREGPGEFFTGLFDELGLNYPQASFLSWTYGQQSELLMTSDEIVRGVKMGRIPVPTSEEAQAELKRMKNKRAAEKRKATIARKKAEAAQDAKKVVQLKPRK